MDERTRKTFYFFLGIILPLILIIVSFIPGISNILLTIVGLIWLGFSILLLSPSKE